MKIKYMTIEREYGSGGTQIARRLEANTGIPCYGKEIITNVSKALHMSVDEIEKYEQTVSGSFLYTLYLMAQAHEGNSNMLTKEGEIYVAEQREIQTLAKKGSAIFLGHCASEALKEEKGVVKVFIRCSDPVIKEQRIIKEYGISRSEVERVQNQYDKKRANYYYANTSNKWRDYSKYDMVLDSAALGIEGCVAALNAVMFSID
jgi:cytidylate kinase